MENFTCFNIMSCLIISLFGAVPEMSAPPIVSGLGTHCAQRSKLQVVARFTGQGSPLRKHYTQVFSRPGFKPEVSMNLN